MVVDLLDVVALSRRSAAAKCTRHGEEEIVGGRQEDVVGGRPGGGVIDRVARSIWLLLGGPS